MMDIIYSYSSGSMILYNKYKIYYHPINRPNYSTNYEIKVVQENINCSINQRIQTLVPKLVSGCHPFPTCQQ